MALDIERSSGLHVRAVRKTVRKKIGRAFSEGARRSWAALEKRGWSQEGLRRKMLGPSGRMLSRGVIPRWLNGDRGIDDFCARQIERLLGVPAPLWRSPSQDKAFRLPAARKAAKAAK